MASEKSALLNNNPTTAKQKRKYRLIVEPLTVVFMLAYGLIITLRVEYLKQRLSREANFTQPTSNSSIECSLNKSSSEYDHYLEVQSQTSYWTLYLAVAQAVPALISANLLGALSDSKGRRFAMVFPIVGFTIYSVVYALVAHFDWPLYVLIVGTIPLGVCGDFLTLVACSFAYIADTTLSERRTYRMVILECASSLSPGVGQLAVGYILQATGFPLVYYMIIALMLICLAYLYFLPESLPKVASSGSERDSGFREKSGRDVSVQEFFRSLGDLFRPDSNGRCWKMLSYNYILFQFILIIISYLSISVLFATGEPFCWSTSLVGLFNGLTFIFAGIGLVVGGYVLRLCFSDHATMQISILSFVAGLLLTAFARTDVTLFIVTAVGALRMLAMPMCRAKMSKLIGPDEQGILFACSGCIQSVGTLLSPVIFNALYPVAIRVSQGFIFVVMATTFIIPVMLTLALQIDDRRRRQPRYVSLQ